MCHNKGDEFHGRGWAPGLLSYKAPYTNTLSSAQHTEKHPTGGQPLITVIIWRKLLSHQVTKTTGHQQATASGDNLCFPKPPIQSHKRKGGKLALTVPLDKSHFPPSGVAVTLLGYQMDKKTKVNIVIFCFVSGTGGVVPSTQSVNSNNARCNKRTGFPPSPPHPHQPNASPSEITHLEETHRSVPRVHMLLPNGSG